MDEISNKNYAATRNFVCANLINAAAQRSGSRLVQFENCRDQHGLWGLQKATADIPDPAAGSWFHGFLVESKAGYSKLVAAPLLDLIHLSKSAWLSTVRKPPDMAEWPLPQSWAQLIW
jgi:hypothetical protein